MGACLILKLRVIREGHQPSRRQLVEAVLVQSSMAQGVTRIKGSAASIIFCYPTLTNSPFGFPNNLSLFWPPVFVLPLSKIGVVDKQGS